VAIGNEQFLMRDIGYWDALAWGSLFLVLLLLLYLLLGRKKGRTAPEFLSGEAYDSPTPAYSFFYGFERVLAPIFHVNERFHSNVINEYVAWLLMFALLSTVAFIAMHLLGLRVI
jgi:hypothetical protein